VPDRIRADSGRQINESRQPSKRLILVELIQPEALRAEGPLGMGAPRRMGPARLSAGATATAAAAAATATFALTALTGAIATTAAGAAGGGGSTGAAKGGGTGTGHRQLLG